MRSPGMRGIAAAILLRTTFLCAQPALDTARDVCTGGKTIASRRVNNVAVVLKNERGAFADGNNNFCVEFRKPDGSGLLDVGSVSIEFSEQIGRIREEPSSAQIIQQSMGTYLGRMDFGRQYFNPATYYAVIHYSAMTGKKTKVGFIVTVKSAPAVTHP
jgi:hypothetical protein